MSRSSRAFSRRVLVSQLAVIVATLALVTGVFAWMAARAVTDVSETEALATARALASAPEVREGSTRASEARDPMPAKEITDSLRAITRELRDRSGIQFAVITDDRGIRLTHPNPDLIGKPVSTSPDEALAGRESVTQEVGTLGSTVRAKVPIYSSTGDGTVAGEVSVGIHTSVLNADLRREFAALGSVSVLALGIGVLASITLGRRLRRETLGVGPEELAEMARDQGAVLRGLDDGVLGFDSDGELTLSNAAARDLLAEAADDTGTDSSDTDSPGDAAAPPQDGADVREDIVDSREGVVDDLPVSIRTMMAEAPEHGALRRRITVGDKILLATAVRVRRDGVSVGGVVTLRDETTMLTMARQLESVTAMADALRAQRHEFANRLHTVLGLVDTGATDEASSYLESILGTGPLAAPVEGLDPITDPYLRAVLEAKGTTAAEAGVTLRVAPDSLVIGRVTDPEDVTLVLGNLIDNAVRAVVRRRTSGEEAAARPPVSDLVEVELLGADGELHGLVTDTGSGIDPADAERIFDEGVSGDAQTTGAGERADGGDRSDDGAGPIHGLGLGLALCRRVANRHDGRVWLVDGHDPHLGGASFGMRLPGVLIEDDEKPPRTDDTTVPRADETEKE
ncbi:ATP-binding protein [Brevibacterium casei]|uniref:Sensor-like histidine kinase SenX3 n=1 Tax=Brevibacterium casei TaxID=33889 RepID=A0A449D789_9MICO|nr:sensor histidine kinase [Brevibacterium casei]VEW13467.1 Sensor histidine kinase DcuS [Brevibacterium casei]